MKKGMIIFCVVLAIVIAGGFYEFQTVQQEAGQSLSLSTLTTTFSEGDALNSDMDSVRALLASLGQVSALSKLDTTLFDDPAYKTLHDFSVTLFPAQVIGRENPFLEIGKGDSSSVVIPTPQPVSTQPTADSIFNQTVDSALPVPDTSTQTQNTSTATQGATKKTTKTKTKTGTTSNSQSSSAGSTGTSGGAKDQFLNNLQNSDTSGGNSGAADFLNTLQNQQSDAGSSGDPFAAVDTTSLFQQLSANGGGSSSNSIQ